MRKIKIILSLLLILSFIPIIPGLFSYADSKYSFVIPNVEKYTELLSLSEAQVYELAEELRTAATNYEAGIDLGKYHILFNLSSTTGIYDLLFDGSEMIHISSLQNYYYPDTNEYARVEFNYIYSEEDYKKNLVACKNEARKYLEGIDDSLSDLEKALIIHDRLAVNCEYDQAGVNAGKVPDESYTMYGVFINKVAVCQGYTHAYSYLLNLLGIQSYSCRSTAMNHVWNILLIDGEKYHVDVTWDDPVEDLIGRVMHSHFLKSSNVFLTSHPATDYDTSPSDTKYDNAFWEDSKTQFCLLDGEIYYIDNTNGALKKYDRDDFDGSDDYVIHQFEEKWRASATSAWKGNFSMLAADENVLIFTTNNAVYYYLPSAGEDGYKKLMDIEMPADTYFNIFGMHISNNVITLYTNNNPNNPASTGTMITFEYNIELPTSIISGTLEFLCNPTPGTVPSVFFFIYKNSMDEDRILSDIQNDGFGAVAAIPVEASLEAGICKVSFSQKIKKGNYKICVVSNMPDAVPLIMDCSALDSNTQMGTVHVYKHGDISGDYEINITDALMTLRVALKVDKKHADLVKVMDCNGDNLVTTADASIILQYSVGIREYL